MLKTIKTFTRNLIIGANVATVIMMLLVGYSGRLNPESFPILSNACLTFPIFLVINVFFLFFWLLFYPKGTLVSLLGIIISYVPVRTYCPLNLKSEKPVGCIKVMTYNVDGSMKKETDAQGRVTYPALEYIGASGADVVCVQEAYMTREKAASLRHIYQYADKELYNSGLEIGVTKDEVRGIATQVGGFKVGGKRETTQNTTQKVENLQPSVVQLDLFGLWDEQEEQIKKNEPRDFSGKLLGHWRNGTIVEDNGQIGMLSDVYPEHAMFNPGEYNARQEGVLRQYIKIRDAYRVLFDTEADTLKEQPELREALNKAYDTFVRQYGAMSDRKNYPIIIGDIHSRDALSLERSMDGKFVKADIFERPVAFNPDEEIKDATALDALYVSLNRDGYVHFDVMSEICGLTEEQMKADGELTKTLTKLFALAEAYPDLKANDNFMELQTELSNIEEKISTARQFYSDSVLNYNNRVQMFPSNIVASMFGFREEKYFEALSEERENVKVKFD